MSSQTGLYGETTAIVGTMFAELIWAEGDVDGTKLEGFDFPRGAGGLGGVDENASGFMALTEDRPSMGPFSK